MLSREEEFNRLESAIRKFDSLFLAGKMTPVIIEKCQKLVDDLDNRLRANVTVENKNYRLYELQGLIDLAEGKVSKAGEFIDEAANSMPSSQHFLSKAVTDYWNTIHESKAASEATAGIREDASQSKLVAKYNGRLEGWLTIYALRLIVLPLILIWDIVSTRNLLNGVDTSTGLGSSLSTYMGFVYVGDIVGIILAIYIATIFFGKKRGARNQIRYFEGYIAIYYLTFTIWISNIYSSNNLGDSSNSVGSSSWGFILAVIWLLYWTLSKRVKATFTQ